MSRDAFDVMGLEARFDLTPAVLQAAYLTLSASLHPDTAGGDSAYKEGWAAELNAAKRQLEDPEARADILLRRLGGPSKDRDKSLPPTFLAEMLEVREEIQAAIASEDPEAIEKWQDWATDRRREHIGEVGVMFRSVMNDTNPTTRDSAMRAIRTRLNQWRYIERLIEQLDEAAM